MPDIDLLVRSSTLLAVLLNPFLMSVYLLDLIQDLDKRTFNLTLARGAAIATTFFIIFAMGGDAIFRDLLQVRFASFQIFGGVLFLMIGLQFVKEGPSALRGLRGSPAHIAGSIAMPFMIGPGTVSASVLAGARLPWMWAIATIVAAMVVTVLGLVAVKAVHDHVNHRNGSLVDRYVDIVGRVSALIIGTIAIDMILSGLELWWNSQQS